MLPDVLTLEETARLLRVRPVELMALADRKEIRPLRVDPYLFDRADVVAFQVNNSYRIAKGLVHVMPSYTDSDIEDEPDYFFLFPVEGSSVIKIDLNSKTLSVLLRALHCLHAYEQAFGSLSGEDNRRISGLVYLFRQLETAWHSFPVKEGQ